MYFQSILLLKMSFFEVLEGNLCSKNRFFNAFKAEKEVKSVPFVPPVSLVS